MKMISILNIKKTNYERSELGGVFLNPVLVLLILIGAILLWVVLAKAFRTIGGAANSFADDVKNAVYDNEEENYNEE